MMVSAPVISDHQSEITTAEKILQVATSAFARNGFKGASIREIAREVGISVATLYYYVASKDELYHKVFQRQYQEEYDLIYGILRLEDDSVVQDPGKLRTLLYLLVDALIDRSVQNPDIVRLWTSRWLEKPRETEDIEAKYSIPLYQMIDDLLERACDSGSIRPEGISLSLLSHSFTWLHYGFCGYGRLTFFTTLDDRCDPEVVEEFRQFIHIFLSRMLRFTDQTP